MLTKVNRYTAYMYMYMYIELLEWSVYPTHMYSILHDVSCNTST